MHLRPYQQNTVNKIKSRFSCGIRSQLAKLATGLGKSAIFSSLPEQLNLAGRVLVLDHREELTNQALDKMQAWNPSRSVGVEMGERRSNGEQIVVAGVATIGRKGSPRLLQFDPATFDLLVIDECFPSGTLVNGARIERLQPGDTVVAYNEATQNLVPRKVLTTFKRRPSSLVRVSADGFSVYCTPNHPFLTERGWVAAAQLKLTDKVKLYETIDAPTVAWVDSVKVIEAGSDGTFGGVCRDGFVYNLEVESDHTYLANGFVVHNCHHATAQSYRTVIDHFEQNKKLLHVGFTATPNRADGDGLGSVYQEIIDDVDMMYGIREGWLADIRGIRIKTGVNLNNVHSVAGDFNQGELGTTVNTPMRNDLIVRSWLEHTRGLQTVMFCAGVQHAKDLADAFRDYGIAAVAVWGDDPERACKLAKHRSQDIQVITNDSVLVEGYDDWRIGCIGLARPNQSEGRYVQEIGRGGRIPDGVGNLVEARRNGVHIAKGVCFVLDFVDSTSKHSLVTLATLYGMPPDTDLRGKPLSKVVEELEEAQKKNPLLDLTRVHDIDQLKGFAEAVDLFKVTFPPEVVQISSYQWHKTRPNAYALALTNGEGVCVISDLLGVWHILGDVNECHVALNRPTFEEAIREADYQVGMLGGRSLTRLITREARWHSEVPTEPQLRLCKRMRIAVPPGATKGEVAMKLSQAMRERAERRVA